MIKNLEINNVGRFKSLKTDEDEKHFKKSTFIYGRNTFGKSTLTAIFRSLKENNPDYIIGRRTVGAQKQVVKIYPETVTSVGEYRYTTDENKWSAEYKDIIIFDSHFVRESVYTQNQQIGQEQQKNIELFMLGAKGVEYNRKIDDLTEQISENTKTQTATNTEYSRNKHLLGNFTFEEFLGLTQIDNVDKKIKDVKKGFDRVKNFELISNKLNNIKMLLERYRNFDTTNISKKLSVNSELITKHFNDHVNQKETKQAYSTFLQIGSTLRARMENERCPFCTQEVKVEPVKEFLNTIDLVYNENYRNLQQALKEAESLFVQKSFSTETEKIRIDLQQAGYTLEMDFSDISNLLKTCIESIVVKKEDLSSAFNSSMFVDISIKANSYITTIDAELLNFKNPDERKSELDNYYKELLANRERFSSWKERCENYLTAKKNNEGLSAKKTTLWEAYLVYASGLSVTMLEDINSVLHECNCNFTVQTFKFKGNQRQDLLVLSMEGTPILNHGVDYEMTVKNCLSDSDKLVLALAFFLATVKNDVTVKVVVMDDPVSSFDSDRKRTIMKEIKRVLAGTDKQLILLTHEKDFYRILYAESAGDASVAFLKISFNARQGSNLISCNPTEDAEFMDEFNYWIANMKSANISEEISFVKNAHSYIRLVIEHILKTKYPLELTGEYNTIGKKLTRLEQAGGSYATISRRTEINDILINQLHHDNSGVGQYPVSKLGIDDYKKDIRDAFEVMKIL